MFVLTSVTKAQLEDVSTWLQHVARNFDRIAECKGDLLIPPIGLGRVRKEERLVAPNTERSTMVLIKQISLNS